MATDLYKETNDREKYFFLSYNKENADVLRQFVPNMRFNVWYDQAINRAGTWTEDILRHLLDSQAVILFLSKAALREECDSFVYLEYNVAIQEKKDIYVVCLEDVKYEDFPDSLKFWHTRMRTKQMLEYNAWQTVDELLAEIHAFVKERGVELEEKTTLCPMQMHCMSNFLNDQYQYVGYGDVHYSAEEGKICLYNHKTSTYEIRLLDNIDVLLAKFKQKAELLKNSQIFYTPQDDYFYFLNGGKIYTYSLAKHAWLQAHGTALPLNKKEEEVFHLEGVGNKVYFLTQMEKEYAYCRMLHYDIAQNQVIAAWNLRPHNIRKIVAQVKDRSKNWVLCYDESDRLLVIDLEKGEFVTDWQEELSQMLVQRRYAERDADELFSRDAGLYAVESASKTRVFNAADGSMVAEVPAGTYQNIYLLANGTVLEYDNQGNVLQISPKETNVLLNAAFFKQSEVFENAIPHTMFYDEPGKNYLFVLSVARQGKAMQKIVVLNEKLKPILVSSDMGVPFRSFYCKCSAVKGCLLVHFCSNDTANKKAQNTFIYRGEYRWIGQ